MYLEIRLKNYFIILLVMVYFLSANSVVAQESKDIPINVVKSEYIKSDIKKIDKNFPEKQYRLFNDSSVYRVNTNTNVANPLNNITNLSRALSGSNIVGKYLFAYTKSELSAVLRAHASEIPVDSKIKRSEPVLIDKFRVILDENNHVYFTDGSFLIKFNSATNYSNFASLHNLMLKKEYIDLNMGLYVHSDFNSLEDKMNFLKDINTISSVRYNVINPYILPE
jgi:hypothetical protein